MNIDYSCLAIELINNIVCNEYNAELEVDTKEYHEGNDSSLLTLCKPAITNIKEVKIFDGILDPTTYETDLKKGTIRLKNSFFVKGMDIIEQTASSYSRTDKIQVTLSGGYDFPKNGSIGNLPCALDKLFNDLLLAITAEKEQGNLKSYSISDISYAFKENGTRLNAILNMIRVIL